MNSGENEHVLCEQVNDNLQRRLSAAEREREELRARESGLRSQRDAAIEQCQKAVALAEDFKASRDAAQAALVGLREWAKTEKVEWIGKDQCDPVQEAP